MNLRDMSDILIQLSAAARHLRRLAVMVQVHQQGKVLIADEEMPLTSGQKEGIKTKAETLGTKLATGADMLPQPTGKTGVPIPGEVAKIQAAPPTIFRVLQDLITQTEDAIRLLRDTTNVETDGSISSSIDDVMAQQTANALATLRDATKWWITQELAKLT